VKHEDLIVAIKEHSVQDEVRFTHLTKTLETAMKSIRKWGLIGGFLGGLAASGAHLLEGLAGCSAVIPKLPTSTDVEKVSQDTEKCVNDWMALHDASSPTALVLAECRLAANDIYCAQFPNSCAIDAGK
jgi:hypothetical protein